MKFRFDYLNNRLNWKIENGYSYEVAEENRFTTEWGQPGFVLDQSQPNHWITFTVYPRYIRTFYKYPQKDGSINYYQKDVPVSEDNIIEFEFIEEDRVARREDGKWEKIKEQ